MAGGCEPCTAIVLAHAQHAQTGAVLTAQVFAELSGVLTDVGGLIDRPLWIPLGVPTS